MKVSFSLVLIGLDASGKTTMVRSMRNSNEEVFPTPGLSVDYISIQKIPKPILVYDCSGAGMHRSNWKTFYRYVDGVVFFVDVSDSGRLPHVKNQLQNLLKDQLVSSRQLPVCVMLNKCDKQHQNKQIFYQALGIQSLQKTHGNKMFVKETSGFTKQGLEDCFSWLQSNI